MWELKITTSYLLLVVFSYILTLMTAYRKGYEKGKNEKKVTK